MAYIIGHNILSPLGSTSVDNYKAVKEGHSALSACSTGSRGVPEGFCASLFSEAQNNDIAVSGLTLFESSIVVSAEKAIIDSGISVSDGKTVLIISTTKGNTDLVSPADSAKRIAKKLNIPTEPIVVCNACISGLAAVILGKRLIEAGSFDYAVVCGADRQGKFIISGFQSLKALSPEECRPFDIERLGLNLGEAAATVVMSREKHDEDDWNIVSGAIRNDAYHVSAPSRKGEGLYRALNYIVADKSKERLAFVNAHGTATMFNDQMESVALQRMGYTDIPVNALKGYFGHTMGAAGILELVLSMLAANDGYVIGTRGFEELGVSGNIMVSANGCHTDKRDFIKMLSGFGGCNAAVWVSKDMTDDVAGYKTKFCCKHSVKITPDSVSVDGKDIEKEGNGKTLLTNIYKTRIGGYAKFYKMDGLSRLGFIASELLLQTEDVERFKEREDRATVLFNHSSSVDSDRKYMESIVDAENYFPSPSVFVYTLPNIVTGEIAMRNKYYGETSFYILPDKNEKLMHSILQTAFSDKKTTSIVCGWIDYIDDGNFVADIGIYEKEDNKTL